MGPIAPFPIWVGHFGDMARPDEIAKLGIQAIVDLADNEKPSLVFRDVVYCRIPLVDGSGNPEWLLKLAVETVVRFLQANVPTFVFCSAGLSRSPAIVATAISLFESRPLNCGLEHLKANGAFDISPSLWGMLEALYSSRLA